jgi:hypothetical protein
MGDRHPNPRLVKMHRNYDTHELSKLLGIHKNTLRSWTRIGLKPIDGRRPALFLGLTIRDFLTERRRKKHQTCRHDQLYCLVCKAPKTPDGKMVDYLPISRRSGNLRGLCPDCGNLIHRCTSLTKLSGFQAIFQVAFPQGLPRIEETRDPCLNCDSKEGTNYHD